MSTIVELHPDAPVVSEDRQPVPPVEADTFRRPDRPGARSAVQPQFRVAVSKQQGKVVSAHVNLG